MPTVNLTNRFIESLKPIPGKRREFTDAKVPGLTLRITEAGVKSWSLRYSHRGRVRRLTLGTLAALSLDAARTRARNALTATSDGADPASEKQRERGAQTIRDLADLYIERYAKPKKRSWKADKNLLDHKVVPHWGRRAVLDITRNDALALVEKVADAGAPIVANRVAALLSKIFTFALDRGLLTDAKGQTRANPASRIPRPGRETRRDRVLTDDEIRSVWASFDALDAKMAAFFKLRLLTAQRGGEVAEMRWQDVDLDGAWWTIPASVTKNKLPHRVPLSPAVVTLITTLKPTVATEAIYVLGAAHRSKGSGARGKRQQSEAAATITVPDFRGHDLRRTAASAMTSGGVPRLIVGKILNHAEAGVTAVYDRHSYDAEKRAALDWWALKLDAILENTRGTVLPFARSADVA